MAAPPLRTEISDTYPNPSNATARAGFGKLWDYVTGLLGATGNAPEARAALGVSSAARTIGLAGNVNSAAPLSKYDLAARAITLRDSDGGTVTRYATGTITCDLGAAGPVANGRDQAGAFSANSWVYLYFIWNGATVSTVSSVSASAPSLPAGYTHWVYAGPVRVDGAGSIVRARMRGCRAHYDIDVTGANRVLAAGSSATFSSVNCSALVPPDALSMGFVLLLTSTGASGGGSAYIREAGSVVPNGYQLVDTAPGAIILTNYFEMPIGTSVAFDYRTTQGQLYVDLYSYRIPNGDC